MLWLGSVALFHETERNLTKLNETEQNPTKPNETERLLSYKSFSVANPGGGRVPRSLGGLGDHSGGRTGGTGGELSFLKVPMGMDPNLT